MHMNFHFPWIRNHIYLRRNIVFKKPCVNAITMLLKRTVVAMLVVQNYFLKRNSSAFYKICLLRKNLIKIYRKLFFF